MAIANTDGHGEQDTAQSRDGERGPDVDGCGKQVRKWFNQSKGFLYWQSGLWPTALPSGDYLC